MDQTTGRQVKDGLYEQFARIGKAIAHPKRIELLDLLCQGERSVEVLAKAGALSVTNASAHLRVLREARLVENRKQGTRVIRCCVWRHSTAITARAPPRLDKR